MEIIKGKIEGLYIFKPKVFYDERGYFFESYSNKVFEEIGVKYINFVQDNQSYSRAGVVRGLHLQNPPYGQGKLVRVVKGRVLDVAVDVRKNSPTYGQHQIVELTDENGLQFWIPEGFAHGFISLKDNTVFSYKCSKLYHKNAESGILWCDPLLNINWGVDSPIISTKDAILPKFNPEILYF